MPYMTLIADLHGRTPHVREDSYLVLIAGDICPDGGVDNQELFLDGPFREWLTSLPCPCVAVPGNHDEILDETLFWDTALPWHLLRENGCVTTAGVTVWGQPYVLDGGAFKGSEEDIERALAGMPHGVDVLLSHQPAAGIHDYPSLAHHPGSAAMRHTVWKREPKLLVTGHVHEARGHGRFHNTYCVNATLGAGCDRYGKPVPAPHTPWGLSSKSWS